MKKITFPKGIDTIHIPFTANIGSYNQLYKQIKRIKFPKSARRVEASLVVSIDLKEQLTNYQIAQVTLLK